MSQKSENEKKEEKNMALLKNKFDNPRPLFLGSLVKKQKNFAEKWKNFIS
jgi:hypothetical protein